MKHSNKEFLRLPVLLTQAELVTLGEELAHTHKEINTLTEEKARLTARMKPKVQRIEELVVLIDEKSEIRDVECKWEFYWKKGSKALVRQDTFAVVKEDLIQERERQQHLFDTDEEVPAGFDVAEPVLEIEWKEIEEDTTDRDAWRDSTCGEWRECSFAEPCFAQDYTGDAVCLKDEAAKAIAPEVADDEDTTHPERPTFLGMDFQDMMKWSWSRDEAKLLAAGFRLVRLDREMKRIDVSCHNPRLYWTADTVRETFAAAERDLKRAIEGPEQFVEVSMDGQTQDRGHKLKAAGFTFYRVECLTGHHEQCRIKIGPNWSTWKKFDTPAECQAAWDDLMDNDPMALEG